MLYKFKSKAAGDVIMTGPHGDQLLQILDKEPSPTGILTVDQMPAALKALEAAVAAAEALAAAPLANGEPDPEDHPRVREAVTLRQRVWPFMELIRYSLPAKADIVWGV